MGGQWVRLLNALQHQDSSTTIWRKAAAVLRLGNPDGEQWQSVCERSGLQSTAPSFFAKICNVMSVRCDFFFSVKKQKLYSNYFKHKRFVTQ